VHAIGSAGAADLIGAVLFGRQHQLTPHGKIRYLTEMRSLVTRLSSKGQVVIPAAIRDRLGLVPGDELRIAVDPAGEGSITLRRPGRGELQGQLERGYRWLEAEEVDPLESLHASRRAARADEARRR
jgi:AbrB family looped-hinge helix DNA binding protein